MLYFDEYRKCYSINYLPLLIYRTYKLSGPSISIPVGSPFRKYLGKVLVESRYWTLEVPCRDYTLRVFTPIRPSSASGGNSPFRPFFHKRIHNMGYSIIRRLIPVSGFSFEVSFFFNQELLPTTHRVVYETCTILPRFFSFVLFPIFHLPSFCLRNISLPLYHYPNLKIKVCD